MSWLYLRSWLAMVNWNRFRRHHSLSLYDKPARERHLVSLTCSILSVITLIIALILPQWAYARIAGHCDCEFGLTKVFCLDPKTTQTQSTNCETIQSKFYDALVKRTTLFCDTTTLWFECRIGRTWFDLLFHLSWFSFRSPQWQATTQPPRRFWSRVSLASPYWPWCLLS